MHITSASSVATFAALLLAVPSHAAAQRMYTKKSPVLQLDSKNFDKSILKSHLPSVVEFYAPWCGHCQSLKPAYEKAAESLAGIVNIAAIDCDADDNKPLCGQYGIQGFPTIKTFRPASLVGSASTDNKSKSKKGKPAIVDYKGPRSAKDIVAAAKTLLPNLVERVTDDDLEKWLNTNNDTTKALLFSEKGTTSAQIKALALDFRGSLTIAQVRDREDNVVDAFGVEKFPTLVLLPGGSKAPVTYSGEMTKADMFAFLKDFADPVSSATDAGKSQNSSKSKGSNAKPESSSEKKKSTKQPAKPTPSVKVQADDNPVDEEPAEPDHPAASEAAPPPPPPSAPALEMLSTDAELTQRCLGEKTGTCILVSVPSIADNVDKILAELAAVSQRVGPPALYAIAPPVDSDLSDGLGLGDYGPDIERVWVLVAVNGKRGWMRRFPKDSDPTNMVHVADWIEGVKLGDVKKEKLPEGLIRGAAAADAEMPPPPPPPNDEDDDSKIKDEL